MKDHKRQSETFSVRGHWNVPDSSRVVSGDLVYDEENLTLSLYGGLNTGVANTPISMTLKEMNFPIVHGTLLDGTEVTLFDCFYTSYQQAAIDLEGFSPGQEGKLSHSKLSCAILIMGVHLFSQNEQFDSCQIKIPFIEEWLAAEPFKVNFDLARNVKIEFLPPADEVIKVAEVLLTFKHAIRPPGLPLGNSPTAIYSVYTDIKPSTAKDFFWFRSINGELLSLLSYLYGSNISSSMFVLKRRNLLEEFPAYYNRHSCIEKSLKDTEFWTKYSDIKENFGKLLGAWLDAESSQKRARNMLISSERRPASFIELRFLPLMQTLEVLSQNCATPEILPRQEYKVIKNLLIEAIPNTTPCELSDSIKGALGHANGKSLRFKIEQLLDSLSSDVTSMLCSNVKEFVKGIVDTRNFYTHYSEQKTILQKIELHWAIRKLSVLIRVLLLRNIGMEEDMIASMLKKNIFLRQERSSWKKVSEVGTGVGALGD